MKNILVFDIGGTFVKWGILNESYEIIKQGKFPTFDENNKNDIKFIYNNIIDFVNKTTEEIDLISISTAGVINTKTGEVIGSNATFKNYVGFNINNFIKEKTGISTFSLNDGNAGVLGEYIKGSLKNINDSAMIVLGTGIGAGFMVNGELFTGSNYRSGEVGFMYINGVQWEIEWSAINFISKVNKTLNQKMNGEKVFELIETNETVKKIYSEFLDFLAIGLSNIVRVMNPKMISIGGGISGNNSFKTSDVLKRMEKYLDKETFEEIKLTKATLGNDANLIGAAYFANINNK